MMSEMIALTAADGHEFDAYVARPNGPPTAALVVIQEIFGVNDHIRRVADNFANAGYLAVAPALFDRYEKNVQLDYSGEGWQTAMGFAKQLNMDWIAADVRATIAYTRKEGGVKTGIVGYCLGGSVAWAAAANMPVDAAVGYYGGMIASRLLDQAPRVPILLHFGEHDDHIPMSDVDSIKAAYPDVPLYTYDAGHGFNCDARESYDAPAAKLALERTMAFFVEHLEG
jgi:carboxymethylenebutenolidase